MQTCCVFVSPIIKPNIIVERCGRAYSRLKGLSNDSELNSAPPSALCFSFILSKSLMRRGVSLRTARHTSSTRPCIHDATLVRKYIYRWIKCDFKEGLLLIPQC